MHKFTVALAGLVFTCYGRRSHLTSANLEGTFVVKSKGQPQLANTAVSSQSTTTANQPRTHVNENSWKVLASFLLALKPAVAFNPLIRVHSAVVNPRSTAAHPAGINMVSAPVSSWEDLAAQLPAEDDKASPVLTLYRDTNGWCPFCERLLLSLNRKQIPYEEVGINLRDKPQWYKDMIPTALVPAIKVHSSGDIVYESLDIMKYLDKHFPDTEPLMQPEAEVSAALERADALTTAAFRFAYGNRNKSLSDDHKAELKSNFTGAMNSLDAALNAGGPFLAGDRMTAADICLIPMMERYRYQLPLQADMSVYEDDWPGIKRWFDSMDAEPVYAEKVAGDEISWKLVTSTFLNLFARNAEGGIDPETQKRIDAADAAAEAALEQAAAAALTSDLPTPAARHEAAHKLIVNHEAVVADASAGDSEPKSQSSLQRLPSTAAGIVDHVLRNAAARLLGLEPSPVLESDAALAAQESVAVDGMN